MPIFVAMKKLLIIVTFLLSVQLQAQDTLLLQRIKMANMEVHTFQSQITRHLVTSEDVTDRNGEIHFMTPDKLYAEFDNGTYLTRLAKWRREAEAGNFIISLYNDPDELQQDALDDVAYIDIKIGSMDEVIETTSLKHKAMSISISSP